MVLHTDQNHPHVHLANRRRRRPGTSSTEALQRGCIQSVKTVRLCLQLGSELAMPWMEKLDAEAMPKGSARRWVAKAKDGLLVLKA